jgi:uncharacterized glyoxalase superfamily protein PhnB
MILRKAIKRYLRILTPHNTTFLAFNRHKYLKNVMVLQWKDVGRADSRRQDNTAKSRLIQSAIEKAGVQLFFASRAAQNRKNTSTKFTISSYLNIRKTVYIL